MALIRLSRRWANLMYLIGQYRARDLIANGSRPRRALPHRGGFESPAHRAVRSLPGGARLARTDLPLHVAGVLSHRLPAGPLPRKSRGVAGYHGAPVWPVARDPA